MGRACGLGLDTLVQGLRRGVGLRGGVPVQQSGLLLGQQHAKLADGQRSVLQPLLQQPDETLGQRLHIVRLEIRLVVDAMQPRIVLVTVAAQMKGER